jgi:hypothetical protein
MSLIKFDNKVAEGFYLLATHGQVGGYPGDLFAVSDQLLKELETEFQAQGITYQKIDLKTLNGKQTKRKNNA